MIKHFVDIDKFNIKDLKKILGFAKKIKKNPSKYSSILKNKSLGMIFEKQSTRTRLSFDLGMKKLGGSVIVIDKKQIGFDTRESASDILKTMSQYLDAIMIRNNNHNEIIRLSNLNLMPIINGLSDYSHPCQILSDIFTIEEYLGKIENKTVTWLGDINNVLISLIQAAEIFKFNLNILSHRSLVKKYNKTLNIEKLKFTRFMYNLDKGLKDTNCIMTDVWISMGEKNLAIKKKLLKKFQVNDTIMKKAKKNAIFMHCLPAHRNEEVTNSVIDGKQSVVWDQAKNRMFVQQSILCYLLNNDKK